MPPCVCPRCHTNWRTRASGGAEAPANAGNAEGILADKNWLENNMHHGDYQRLTARVFTGSPAGILCPHCLTIHPQRPIEMSKFTVSPGGRSYEVDGCHNCGSMWFDQGELEPYEEGEQAIPPSLGPGTRRTPRKEWEIPLTLERRLLMSLERLVK